MITEQDKALLSAKGITEQQLETQLSQFKTGFPFADIQRPATISDGIAQADKSSLDRFVAIYNKAIADGTKVVKFIPASGAATRMFKNMFEFMNASKEKQDSMKNEKPYSDFFGRFNDFAFADALMAKKPIDESDKITKMLTSAGLGYGQKPKGVVLFHRYEGESLTAAEEHIFEGLNYAKTKDNEINLHYTVSPQHLDLFKEATQKTKEKIEKTYGCKVNITYSFQKPSTDTIAATMQNDLFRDDNGNLVFRPGGHGALIENLNDLDADIVFIKNIDNVAHQYLLPITTQYKKVIAGYGLERKHKIDAILRRLDNNDFSAIAEAIDFMKSELKTNFPAEFDKKSDKEKSTFIFDVLDRPLRVCGMVKNEGEPGGGPFWVKGSNGQVTLQIVESAQIDTNDAQKAAIMKQSTHFNPVDLFCCLRDRNGKKYDLKKFVDVNAGFISYKSLNGKDLKAMELPGLWNGAMANWLTFFVEVPIETFNPVKTVVDLLRPQHQPKK
ncbi:MAG: DUF4301 family protein [Bacteroidales bacterium]|jgi:hypothetical protein|nr:DUF4301 family protein [Bacteroidales bacterium]